jgi:uncharacterized membrane protein
MRLEPWNVASILGMAIASYACRGGGYWLFSKIRPTPFLRSVLSYVPGTLFVSLVAPALATGGPQRWVGAVATLAAMALTRNLAGAIVAGTAAAWAVWSLGGG